MPRRTNQKRAAGKRSNGARVVRLAIRPHGQAFNSVASSFAKRSSERARSIGPGKPADPVIAAIGDEQRARAIHGDGRRTAQLFGTTVAVNGVELVVRD